MKEIEGHKGYFVDKKGNVYSNKSGEIKQLKPIKFGKYLGINLYDRLENGKRKYKLYYIHRLVAQTFIPNPDSKATVNHIDGNKYNNSIENLEWATYKENTQHAYNVLGVGENLYRLSEYEKMKRQNEKFEEYLKKWGCVCVETGEIFKNQSVAAKHFGCSKMNICGAIRFQIKAKGYHFKKYSDCI
jgi:hypothetical protein